MARSLARPNQIADALVARLKTIETDQGRYRQPVQFVGRVYDVDAVTAALPALFVQLSHEESDRFSVQKHKSELGCIVWVVTADPDQPDVVLQNLIADVKECLLSAETLAGAVSMLFYDGSESQVEIGKRIGKAVATMRFRLQYEWSHDTA